jgi:hypothetical protein
MAEVVHQAGELDAALRHLTESIPLTGQFPYTQPLTTGPARLAWIRQARGDTSERSAHPDLDLSSALAGTRTPDLLIRRGVPPSQWVSPVPPEYSDRA